MTRQGFEPAIINETVSAKVIQKMSQVLDVPVSFFFDEEYPYKAVAGNVKASGKSKISSSGNAFVYGGHNEDMAKDKEIALLKDLLASKDETIELLRLNINN